MGYHGYAPGKYAPTRPTEVQAALRLITKQDTFELLSKIIRNVVRHPLQSSNAAIPDPLIPCFP